VQVETKKSSVLTVKRLLVLFALITTPLVAADLNDLDSKIDWKEFANGVWTAQFGDLSDEMRYTDFAVGPPKTLQLNSLSKQAFPFLERKIRFLVTPDHRVVVHIPTDKNERIYGFGLQFDSLQHNNKVLDLKVDHFNRGGGATHAPVPFFVSSRGYGVFFNTAKYLKVYCNNGNRKDSANNPLPVDRNPPPDEPQSGPWLAQPPADAIEASIHGDGMELVVFRGQSLLDVVARYNLYCGGGAMPPLWGLGFWHRVPSRFSAEQTLEEIAKFDQHNIPLDVIGLEPGWQTKSYPCTYEWQKKRFPDPKSFTQGLLDRGIRLNLWENPYVSPEARIYKPLLPLSGSHLVWLGIVPDYTLPEARKILVDQHRADHIDIGISGYKIDEVDGYDFWLWPDHATFPSGTSAEVMRQTYGLQMQQMMHQELFRNKNQRTFGLVRASNGGASGYPFVIYSDSYGHKQYINGVSSASLAGILWCPEIRSARSDREWLNRMHTVCFAPMAMLNAWASGQKPWSFDDVTDSVREVIELRMRLLPYFYSAFARYHQQGIPPVRSMLLEGDQPLDDSSMFMFGESILVAPFYEKFRAERTIQIPKGNWYDFYSGQFVGNGQQITRTAEQMQDRLPLFVKEGAVIPMLAKSVRNTDAAYGRPLEVRHYGKQAGSFDLYEDDGKTFDYERGKFRVRRIRIDASGQGSEEITGDEDASMFGSVEAYRSMTK
jgi:alpha-D-xyloside xylohydrolase